jgi:hypothetical protein
VICVLWVVFVIFLSYLKITHFDHFLYHHQKKFFLMVSVSLPNLSRKGTKGQRSRGETHPLCHSDAGSSYVILSASEESLEDGN